MPKYAIHVYDEDKYASDPDPKITNLLFENNRITNTQDNAAIIISAGGSNNLGIEINGVAIRNNLIINTGGGGDGITIRYDGIVRNI